MNIHLYLEDDTEIVSFYDMTSNPFKLGDVLHLDVDDMFPKDLEKYPAHLHNSLKEKHQTLYNTFRLKRVEIIREWKGIRITFNEPKITIEYYCKLIN